MYKVHRVKIKRKNNENNIKDDIFETSNHTTKQAALDYISGKITEIGSNYYIIYHKCKHHNIENQPCVIKLQDIWESD